MQYTDNVAFGWRWGWTCHWYGWHRLLWFAFMLDTRTPVVGAVFLGLAVTFGKNKLPPTTISNTGT